MLSREMLQYTLKATRVKEAMSDELKYTLGGALGGLGLGGITWMLRPKDEDQKKGRELLRSMLTGAVLGGSLGYGYTKLPFSKPKQTNPNEGLNDKGEYWSTEGKLPTERGQKVSWETFNNAKGAKTEFVRKKLTSLVPSGATPTAMSQNGHDYTVYYTDKRGKNWQRTWHGPTKSIWRKSLDTVTGAF